MRGRESSSSLRCLGVRGQFAATIRISLDGGKGGTIELEGNIDGDAGVQSFDECKVKAGRICCFIAT